MSESFESLPHRRTARVLIVDESDRALLFYGPGLINLGSDYYFTVGGGVEEGETLTEAAVREIREEVGLRVELADLGEAVAHTKGPWQTHRGKDFYSDDSFFFLRVPHFEVRLDGLEPAEAVEIERHEWLSPDELESSEDFLYPIGLAGVLKRCLTGDVPPEPVELAWAPPAAGPAV